MHVPTPVTDRGKFGAEGLPRIVLLLVVVWIVLAVTGGVLGILGDLLGPLRRLLGIAVVVLMMLWLTDRL